MLEVVVYSNHSTTTNRDKTKHIKFGDEKWRKTTKNGLNPTPTKTNKHQQKDKAKLETKK